MRLTPRVKQILSWYESDNPGTKANLARMLMTGRLAGTGRMVILPVDQGFEHGPARSFAPNPDAYDPHYHFKLAIDAGLDTGDSGDTPVIPIILGSSQRALAVSQMLLERGINARPILYPAVRESAARVRFFLTSEHSEDDIVRAVETLAAVVAATA